MKDLKKLIIIVSLIVLALSSCGERLEIVFDGKEKTSKKLVLALEWFDVYPQLVSSGDGSSFQLLIKERKIHLAKNVIAILLSILKDSCQTKSFLSNYFLPRPLGAYNPLLENTVLYEAFERTPGVFHVSCLEKSYPDNESNSTTYIVWYNSKINSESSLKEEFRKKESELGLSLSSDFIYKDIYFFIHSSIQDLLPSVTHSRNLIIFEPFSFHVLDEEKVSAGIQFMTLLILFLLSGTVLGYWWGKRNV
jgi:hypothetical protein